MKILILGADGYLGRALSSYLRTKGFEVRGVDNESRRENVASVGSKSLIPLPDAEYEVFDILDYKNLESCIRHFKPDAIIHFAEQPSAPFSMSSFKRSTFTQKNNIIGTLNLLWAIKEVNPKIHLIKLGTMGVYGTPEGDIPESDGAIAYDPASFYHISKACDSINIRKACQWWGLNATDLHQGIVYGHYEGTRFDYDYYFGTAINRFLVQALAGRPLTVYGKGGQTRGFININDTLQCIELAINNPPKGYRVFNQFTDVFSISSLAQKVSDLTGAKIGIEQNPRYEKEEHYYKAAHEKLLKLGLKPRNFDEELKRTWETIQPYKNKIIEKAIYPPTRATWK